MATTAGAGSNANLHRSIQNLAHETENKKKAAATQTAVEKRRASLDTRHRYLIEKFAAFIDEKAAVVENSLILGNKVDIVNDFFAENGSRKVLFFWQRDETSGPKAPPVVGTQQQQQQQKTNTLVVTLGSKELFSGVGAFFIRPSAKAITNQTIYTDVYFGPLNATLLPSLTTMTKHVVMPALRAQENWGVLNRQKDESVKGFMEVLEKFTDDLDVAMINLHDSVQLHPCAIDLEAYKKPSDYANAAHTPEVINALEALVTEWCKQIEQVLAESEQMRKEADDIGPNAELAHWKARMVKFNSITDQLKSPTCKKVIGILNAVKSRALLKTWKDLDDRVTDAANESKDNVKYLYTLERFYEPLYRSDPLGMIPAIPGLINAIKMIYSISHFYNTSERMTSLFVKITNQMITSCKEFVYKEGGSKIWDLDRTVLTRKLNECHKLNDAYQRCFHEVKRKLQETPNEKQFDFSEMYIFGKFDAFCKRTSKVIDMLGIIDKFGLLETLGVEGMDTIVRRFNNILTQMQRKPYDILDHRKMEYDSDYNNFKKQVSDLEASLQQFIDSSFEHISSTEMSLELLGKFSRIKDMQLDLGSKYHAVFVHYTRRDLEGVRKLYQKYKDAPPIPRNTPPVSGAIAWARQLYRRIESPMKHFKNNTNVLESVEAKKHIRNYNKLARALIEFEVLWHRSWHGIVDQAKTSLQATLLVSNNEGQVFVNFDAQIVQLIKETKHMLRLGLDVPDSVRNVCSKELYYKNLYNGLVHILQTKKRVLDRVTVTLRRAMAPHIDELDRTLQPGLIALTWTSLNLDDYLLANHKQLARLEELVDKLLDITECRIELGVRRIAEIQLVEVPADYEQWTSDVFIDRTEKRCTSMIQSISNRSNLIESATRDVIAELSKGVHHFITPDLRLAYESVYYNANYQNFEALVQATKSSLDTLRARLGTYTSNQYNKPTSQKPFFKAELVLLIPNVVLQPKLEDIQGSLNKAASMIVDVSKRLNLNWRVFLDAPEDHATAHYPEDTSQVANNKDVLKVIMMLSSTVNSMKKDVESHREQFGRYDFLWKEDKAETIQKFLDSNPTISDFENEINRYEFIEREIVEIPGTTQIGLLLISAEPLKLALLSETKEWKQQYGLNLNRKVKTDMEQLMEYMETKTIKLSRKIADIDDLRIAVQTLSEIRESEVDVDLRVQPIEEAYVLLTKHNVAVTREETEMVDSLRYSWRKLKLLVIDTQTHLSKIQPVFKSELLSSVQKFTQDVKEFTVEYTENGPMAGNIPPKTASERLNVFQRGFDELNRKWETYSAGEELFCLPVTPFPTLVRIKKELKLLQNLYSLYNDVLEKRQAYNETLWSDIDLDKINTEMTEFQNKIKKLPKAIKDWDAFTELKNIVDNLAAMVPLLEMMSNKSMQQRHWDSIMNITKTQFNLDPEMFYVKNLLDAPLNDHREDIEDICTAAIKEAEIEIKLKATVMDWEDKVFTLAAFKTRGNLVLKPSATSEIISQMEDSLMTLASLMSNRYNAPFKPTIQTWVHNLSTASEVIENWLGVQNLWIYLEAVFVGGDIAKQMPKEAKRFSSIDKSWCKIMSLANEHPNVIQCCVLDETIANLLPHLTEQLELCQKSLSGYLESKRAIFPRFYFVSDPALLEILGQASDSHTIQAHLKSVFDNVDKVQFHEKDYDKIIGLESSEGERVALSRPMLAAGNVEMWLGTLLKSMQTSINDIVREAAARVNDVPTQKFMDEYPAQIGLLCLQIQWTQLCEEGLTLSKTDKKKMGATNQRITEILNILIDVTTKELSKMDRTKYETLITIQVHHRDVFEKLYKAHVKSPDDFEWLKQARFYWQETKDCCVVSITNFDFKYQCEYLGCTDRLVITPLTDRCYITLAQALGMSLGGSPAGPAGTGKCWGKGTRLVMYDGSTKAVENIREGELLMGPDSKPRVVGQGSLMQGHADMFRITSTDPDWQSWTCNADHVLVIRNHARPGVMQDKATNTYHMYMPVVKRISQDSCIASIKKIKTHMFKTKKEAAEYVSKHIASKWEPLEYECTVKDYLDAKKSWVNRDYDTMFQSCAISWPAPMYSLKDRIETVCGEPVLHAVLIEVAWAIGLWFASGDRHQGIITQIGSEGASQIPNLARLVKLYNVLNRNGDKVCWTSSPIELGKSVYRIFLGETFEAILSSYNMLSELDMSPRKKMTEMLKESLDVRHAIFAGIIDGAGHFDASKLCYKIVSSSKTLIKSVTALSRGLGLHASKQELTTNCKSKTNSQSCRYMLSITKQSIEDFFGLNPSAHNKKSDFMSVSTNKRSAFGCSSFTIKPIGQDAFFGFSLYNPDGTKSDGRCLLDNFVVTHNTESVKDLGKNLAKWVVVFNCSDQMDYRGLGRIYKGLAQSGAWGCFDEFNRIELPVLSVAAQQIGCVFSARKERKTSFIFTDGDTVELNPEVGMFITMNPGYAGRVELPENLKVHFRYVAMMVPDRQIIIRVKLAGCGFISNLILAKKFFVLYRLCEEQLSKQVHYDFGLRNILSVLRTCGSVKRANPEDSENLIIMRVLRDMNLSKLVDEDETLFLSLVNDLFPGLSAKKSSYPNVEAAVDQQLNEANLINHPPWTLKVIQLYETAKVRHGIMILGPTGTGKCWGKGTRLVMHDGSTKAVEKIREGECLMGPDSMPRIVRHGSLRRARADMFRVTSKCSARTTWTCNVDHVLVVRLASPPAVSRDARNDTWCVWQFAAVPGGDDDSFVPGAQVVRSGFPSRSAARAFADAYTKSSWRPLEFECTVRDYMTTPDSIKARLTMFQSGVVHWPAAKTTLRAAISSALAVSVPSDQFVAQTAWALGLWIAAGVCDEPVITTQHNSVAIELARLADIFGAEKSTIGSKNNAHTIDMGPKFEDLLSRLGLLSSKQIPLHLLTASVDVRQALLAGIIDGSGRLNARGVYAVDVTQRELVDSICHLVRGLGLCVRKIASVKPQGIESRHFRIIIDGSNLASLPTHIALPPNDTIKSARTTARDMTSAGFTVTPVGIDDYFGFELADEFGQETDGRCMIQDFVVTHNSKCINALLKAMTACGDPHKELRMNPKAITDYQMFGKLDVATNDWTDGIFSSLWRKTLKRKGETVWIILDGPVDAVWIENLNSVLDDNKCLTLANGDRIPMSPACKLTFEVHSLRNASPATVSRCGMIYIGVTALTWDIVLKSWFKSRPINEVSILDPLFNNSFGALDQFLMLELHPKMIIARVNYVVNATVLLTGLIPKAEANKSQISADHLERLYVYALFWSFGSLLELDERKKLQSYMFEKLPDLKYPPIEPGSPDTLFEFFVNDNGQWQHWRERIVDWLYPTDSTPEFSSIIIPMVDNVRTEFMIETVTKQGRAVLLIGEPGTAKCWGRNTPILMHSGLIRHVQDIRVGDVVMGPDSTPRTVLSLASGREPMFRIKSECEARLSWTCNAAHILVLQLVAQPWVEADNSSRSPATWRICEYRTCTGSSPESQVPCVATVRSGFTTKAAAAAFSDIYTRMSWHSLEFECTITDYITLINDCIRSQLRMFQPNLIEWSPPEQPLSIRLILACGHSVQAQTIFTAAWAIGLWLACRFNNSSMPCSPAVSRTLKKLSDALNGYFDEDVTDNSNPHIDSPEDVPEFVNLLASFNLIDQTGEPKCDNGIPLELLTESADVRRAFLAGIIDASGMAVSDVSDDSGTEISSFAIPAIDAVFAKDLAHLSRGLGLLFYMPEQSDTSVPESIFASITGQNIATLAPFLRMHDCTDISISYPSACAELHAFSIEPVGNDNYYGFTITGDGRCMLGDFVVTHNTVTVKKYLAKLNPDSYLSKNLCFSSATTPMIFQRTIESYLDKRMGSTYGPPAGKKMIIFIDDINMPEINEWGDQVTGEIVRQLMESQGFYSLDRPGDWTAIVDLFFLGAMMHPGGGRNDIPSRLKRQFVIFNCTIPSEVSVDKIFGTMLEGHFSTSRNFASDVIAMASRLPPITRRLWQMTKVKMLPTPAKFHYIFNLRDLSRIVEGMLNSSPEAIPNDKILLNLWEHECSRVLPDRFITQEDVDWFNKTLYSVVQKELGDEYASNVQNKSYFVDFLREPPENDDPEVEIDLESIKIYERVPSFDVLRARLVDYMKQYNENVRGSKMDLVLFEDAMKHIVRISRIIRTPRGNALLVGVGGSGKQSLTKLAAFIAKSQIFQIAITKNYNVSNLMEDLKLMYKVTGAQGKPMTFIFTDNEVKEEGFLGFINNILTSGEITNLFPKDEIISISSDLRAPLKKQRPNVLDTIENLWQFFIDRVKANLHVVLCFSPVGDKFRNRSLKFPGLISGCTMDWFSRWPNEALRAVADKYVSEMDIAATDQVKREIVYHMGFVHDLVTDACNSYFMQFRRRTHVTPKSYLSFLASYKSYYQNKRTEVGGSSDRMNMGLEKLVEASKSVAVLQDQLVVKEKELAIASKAADAVLADVTAGTVAAEKVKDSVLKVKTKSEAIANAIKADKTYAESQLEAAKPALEEARNALNSIQPSHISTVRKLAKPPHLIMRIMDGVLLLMKRKIDTITQDPDKPCMKPSWSESLKLMSASDFLTLLLNFAKDEINAETVELLEPMLEMPDFNLEGAKKVSADVAGLASWVCAMSTYYGVNKKVIPLKANLIVQEHKLNLAMDDLNKAQQALDEKQAELDVFQAAYNTAITNKQALQADADSCKRKMTAATALISGLKGEKDRWTIQSKEFAERIGRLVGDIILASAFLSYSGPFNQTFRAQLLQDWRKELVRRKIPHTEDLDLIGLLVDNTTVGEWNIQGLPTDELSIQNGIIVTKGTRFPLLVDPQNQAKAWIKNREEQNKLQVTTLSHKYFRQHVEDCVSQGRPMLIEDVEEILDPTLDNILERNLIRAGRTYKVVFGDKEIDWSDGFSLFITTKLPNPNYNPEIYARCSIVDFGITIKGLEEQLLGRVIMREKQELETERAKLLEEVNSNKRKMKQLEDNLLERLTSTKGSLVDDESLIEVLAVTKTTAEEVNEKLVVAAETQKKIGIAREEYRPVASRGSIIYFLISEMSMVNVMYQTSLKQFLQLFDESMEKSQPSPIPSKRIQNIIEYCTFRAFSYITRGLYEVHKLIFVLLLALKIDISMNKVTHEEFRCMIKGGAALDINNVVKKPFNWIPDMTWLNLVALSKMPGFTDVLNQVGKNEKAWRSWYEKDAPENEVLPSGYQNSLDAFRRLLLVRSWCLDRTGMMAKQYIASSMGTRFAESQILDLDAVLSESTNRTPMICLLSQGSDPSSDIENLSKKYKIDIKAISMGQGQEVHARKLLSTFMANGGWALLQNCHLGLPFMDELLSLILDTENLNDRFRLWITCDVSPKFPITFLQMSIKFTNEPPQGVKAGLKRTYAWFSQDMLDMNARPQYKPLLYGLSFLHSVVQERRKFGPLGWNIPYEFNQSDLAASVQFVQNHVDELAPKASISWTTARFMFCEVHYGGRVTDDFDRRLLQTYGKVWFGDHMFADTFMFYKGYTIPHLKTIDEYRQSIESLPLIDTPDVFGLHPNADISCQTKESQRMLDTVMSIQPKDSNTGTGETREEVVKRMANDLLSKLPESFDKNRTKIMIQKQGGPKPLNIFLGQEVDRMQIVISAVKSTLSDLKLAIDGTIIMAPALQNALDALYDARVPDSWVKISWQSSTLGLWYSEFLSRAAQFHTWLYDGRPLVFWLSGFFNPQGFLTAIRQEITRAHTGWALDNVKLASEVMKQMKEDITAPPSEGVYIHGLFIEGAAWDRKNIRLTESQPKVIFQNMPVIHVSATNSTDDPDPRMYLCPVYRRPRRTDQNYIFNVELKTQQSPDYWILRGVALLCATS